MRDDIVGMLKNAIDHGGNPQRVAQSLINSGYPLKDVKEAFDYIMNTIPQQQSPQQALAPPQIPQMQNSAPKSQINIQTTPMKSNFNSQNMQLKPLKPLPVQRTRSEGMGKIIVLAIILILLVISLVSVIVFKDKFLDLLRL